MTLPWFKFNPQAVLAQLSGVSAEGRGIALTLMSVAWSSERPGFAQRNGRPIPPAFLAQMSGARDAESYARALAELESAGFISAHPRTHIVCVTMLVDLATERLAERVKKGAQRAKSNNANKNVPKVSLECPGDVPPMSPGELRRKKREGRVPPMLTHGPPVGGAADKPPLEAESEPIHPPAGKEGPSRTSGVEEFEKAPGFLEFPLRDGSTWPISAKTRNILAESFPELDVDAEIRAAWGWCNTAPKAKLKTANGMPKFLNGWCGRARATLGIVRSVAAASRQPANGYRNDGAPAQAPPEPPPPLQPIPTREHPEWPAMRDRLREGIDQDSWEAFFGDVRGVEDGEGVLLVFRNRLVAGHVLGQHSDAIAEAAGETPWRATAP